MADFISDYRENGDLHPDVSKIIIFSVYLAWKQEYLLWTLIMHSQRFSDSEWNRILKAGDLVVFGISLWSCLVLQLDLCQFVFKTIIWLLIDWLWHYTYIVND